MGNIEQNARMNYMDSDGNITPLHLETKAENVIGLVDLVKSYISASSSVSDVNFDVNIDTGELEYTCESHNFQINETTGHLEWDVAWSA